MPNEAELTGDAAAVRVAFLKRYLADQNQAEAQPLEAYQAMFRGFEALIASEYARLGTGTETDAEAGKPPTENATACDPRDRVDGFVLLDVLGQGGMGTVYRARQLGPLAREVALKVIKLGMDTREVVARFESERQTLAVLDHPNIARVYEARMTQSGRPAFSMELVKGKPLTTFCDQAQLDVTARLQLFLSVCDAVEHAHRKGIVHRDLKPSNVLVAEIDGRATPKVIDFGIAKPLHASADESLRTQVGQVLGTLEYMPPEQADLGGIDVDTRADVYSLGVVLYELLVGALPFDPRHLRGGGLTEALRQIAEIEPQRPSTRILQLGDAAARLAANRNTDPRQLSRALHEDLDWIVARAMAKERDRRYQSVAELGADVRRHLEHLPVLAGPPSLAYRSRKLCRRHRGKLIAGAIVLVLALASAASVLRTTQLERTQRAHERLQAGVAALTSLASAQQATQELERAWQTASSSRQGWEPPWVLAADIGVWQEWQESLAQLPAWHNQAALAFSQAHEAALPGSEEANRARELLSELHWQRFQDLFWQGEEALKPEYVASNLQLLGDQRYLERLQLSGRVKLTSDPPGAQVYCYRYEIVEGRLMPLAHVSEAGHWRRRGEPALVVERLWALPAGETAPPFAPGDRLVKIDGQPVKLLGELVARVNALAATASVVVDLIRDGDPLQVEWTPFATPQVRTDGIQEIDDVRKKLGVTFQAYPLDVAAMPPVGTTTDTTTDGLELELPRGSYLFVFRKPGHLDTRVPVSIPLPPEANDGRFAPRLFQAAEVPPGFVHVPAGWFPAGGDSRADASLTPARHFVGDLLVSRTEISFGEYLEFLRDLERQGRIVEEQNKLCVLAPRWQEVRGTQELSRLVGQSGERVPIVPELDGEPIVVREASGVWRQTMGTSEHPVCGVSVLAALEYALWLTEKLGGRHPFRLPTDLEWEKCARGADRRFYVWGNYPVRSFCASSASFAGRSRSLPRSAAPFDESVHGIRDLAGSLCEPTSSWKEKRFLSIRGGDWFQATDYFLRAANRNGHFPERVSRFQGIRLVADVPVK